MQISMNSKKYNNIKLIVSIFIGALSFLLLLLFVVFGGSKFLRDYLDSLIQNKYLLFLAFVIVIGIIETLILAPLSYYQEYYLEHEYQLSNQSFGQWIWENLKGILIGSVLGIPVLLFFFFVINTFHEMWWLPFAILMFIISVVLAQIIPVVVLPIFYKVTPIADEELKSRITDQALRVGILVENIYKFNMSKNTKKANAAFTGLGSTKRIILGDTLLENFTLDEIETVIAHELGHYKHKHILKNIFMGTLFSFLTFFVIAKLYEFSLSWFGFISITEIAALPLLVLWGMLIGLIQTPISNIISRKFEYEADSYAVESTGKDEIFINTLEKLTDQNLGDREPHPIVEWYFYSHPSIEKRKKNIKKVAVEAS